MKKKILALAVITAMLFGSVSCSDDDEDDEPNTTNQEQSTKTDDNGTSTDEKTDNGTSTDEKTDDGTSTDEKTDDGTSTDEKTDNGTSTDEEPEAIVNIIDKAKYLNAVSLKTATKIVFDLKKNVDVTSLTAGDFIDANNNIRVYTEGTNYYILSEDDSEIIAPEDCSSMFSNAEALTELDFNSFNTSAVTTMKSMFDSCNKLTSLDLSGFNTAKVTVMDGMFDNAYRVKTIYVSDGFVVSQVTSSKSMFWGCSSLKGGNGTSWNQERNDATYAIVDGTDGKIGLFTAKSE